MLKQISGVFTGLTLMFFPLFVIGQVASTSGIFYLPDVHILLKNSGEILIDSLNYDPDSLNVENFEVIPDSLAPDDAFFADFVVPVKGKVISSFGWRNSRMHTGTDIKLHAGDSVFASGEGVVSRARYYYGYGQLAVLEHPNGLQTYYAHLSKIEVAVGDTVLRGQLVGLGGRTGRATTDHLHFEIRENNKPYNPELVFNFSEGLIRDEALTENSISMLEKVKSKIQNLDNPLEYIVKGGDSLWLISRKFRTSVQSLCEINHITPQSILRIGMILKLY
ncbi:MAG: peptidoglycan DD-metalloendopeptidase family protein [Prolixibacteraceae bacterium]|nr:peptidoglycan DD-metalloendopeptidase family protein [Prolixibacteraceae bacterium]